MTSLRPRTDRLIEDCLDSSLRTDTSSGTAVSIRTGSVRLSSQSGLNNFFRSMAPFSSHSFRVSVSSVTAVLPCSRARRARFAELVTYTSVKGKSPLPLWSTSGVCPSLAASDQRSCKLSFARRSLVAKSWKIACQNFFSCAALGFVGGGPPTRLTNKSSFGAIPFHPSILANTVLSLRATTVLIGIALPPRAIVPYCRTNQRMGWATSVGV